MLIAFRQELVGRRVACQNRIRALFAGQGLPVPHGARAWTQTGVAGIAAQSKVLAECGVEELWRGLLGLAVAEYRSLEGRIAECETVLDKISSADPATILLETIPGVGPRTAEVPPAPIPARQLRVRPRKPLAGGDELEPLGDAAPRLGEGGLAEEHLVDGVPDRGAVDPQGQGRVRLRVHVDEEDAAAKRREGRAEVHGGRRLPDAPLLVHDGDAAHGHTL